MAFITEQVSALTTFIFLQLLVAVARASNHPEVCMDDLLSTYNASSERTIRGFYSNRTYSFSTGVKELRNYTTNRSRIVQNYWLTADPMDTTPWQDLPFGGCIYVLSQGPTADLKPNKEIMNPEGATSCDFVLPKECYKALSRQLNSSINHVLKDNIHGTDLVCRSLNSSTPYECNAVFVNNSNPIGVFGAAFSGIPPGNVSDKCAGGIDVFNGSTTQNVFARDSSTALASILRTNLTTTIGNNTVYDYFVQRTNVLFMVAWPRSSDVGLNAQPLVEAVCLCPEEHILDSSTDPVNGGDQGAPNGNAASTASYVYANWHVLITLMTSMLYFEVL